MQTAPRDLTTPRDHITYRLDGGRVLTMRSPYDLSVEEFEELEGLFLQFGFLLDRNKRTRKEIQERQRVTRELAAIAMGRKNAYDLLGDLRASMVVKDFFVQWKPIVMQLRAGMVTEAEPETPSASASSSPRSSASTAAPRARGRATRR